MKNIYRVRAVNRIGMAVASLPNRRARSVLSPSLSLLSFSVRKEGRIKKEEGKAKARLSHSRVDANGEREIVTALATKDPDECKN